MPVTTLQERLRQNNLRIVIDLLRRRDGVSQIELVRETGLRASTVSNLIRELRIGDYVRTLGRGESGATGGKPPVIIGPNPERGVYLGLLWGSGSIAAQIFDFSGTAVTEPVTRELGNGSGVPTDSGAPPILAAIGDLAREQLQRLPASFSSDPGETLFGIGLAVGSVVNTDGTIEPSVDFPWHVPAAAELIRSTIGLPDTVPVMVENDANCVVLDARRALIVVPASILALVVTPEPLSAGAGIMIDDRLVRGWSGSSGELLENEGEHDLRDVDAACAAAIRIVDPEYLAVALPEGIDLDSLPRTRGAIGERPTTTMEQARAALSGAAYLAHRAKVELIVQGGERTNGR